ncbi:FG-GAP repeat domain-containing protein [Persephonella sp.]
MKTKNILAGLATAGILSFYTTGMASDDPLKNRRIIPDVEVIIGDASRDTLMVANYSRHTAIIVMDKKLKHRFDRTDGLISGNVAGGYEDEIIVAYGKKRKKNKYRGELVVYAPDMHVIYTRLDVRYEKGDGLAVCYLEKDRKGYERLVLGSRARDTLEVWSFFPQKKLAKFNVGYEVNDKIACGDIDGDGFDEIVMGDASENQVRIFKYNPKVGRIVQIGHFSKKGTGIFDINDRLGVGDVDGDGIGEIVFLNNNGTVYFFDKKGNQKQKPIKVRYDKYSKMVVGDINRDGYDEIIVGYAKDDIIWVYDYRGRVISNKVKPGFERYDSLAVGDINGDSVVVGRPKAGKITSRIHQIIAVINAPPKEKSLIRKDGSYFYSSFDRVTEMESGIKVKALSGVFTTHDTEREMPVVKNLINVFSNKTKRIIEKTHSTATETITTKTIGYGLKADRYDTAITIKTTYRVYAYPILAPEEFAFKNGKRQYVIVYIPISIATTDISDVPEYISSNHVVGYVASYPDREGLLYNYSPANEIGRMEFNVKCDERHFKIGLKSADIVVEQDKMSRQLKVDKKTFMDNLSSLIPGTNSKTQKNYMKEKITTHTISFTEATSIGVHLKENAYKYCLTEEGYDTDKYEYKVVIIVYYDSEDGHLVVDYYVPEKSPYFKPPEKKPPPVPMLMKDGKVLLRLKPLKGMKIDPGKLKIPM